MKSDIKNGFLIINKPKGITSHDVINKVRKKLGQKRVGHSGTLDPNATGVLVLALGEATKYLQYIKDDKKAYEAEIVFGIKTDTDDVTGNILEEKKVTSLDKEALSEVIDSFIGEQEQIPPIYSAKKVNGRKLYEYARKNQDVEIKPNVIHIESIELLEQDNNKVVIRVNCSRGTYIRSLARDLGSKLELPSTMGDLKRLRSGPFEIKSSLQLEDLDTGLDSHLIPIEEALDYESIKVKTDFLKKMINGQELRADDLVDISDDLCDEEIVKLFCEDKFYGIGIVSIQDGEIYVKPKKMLSSDG